jgi:hypothetical protein
MIRMLQSVIAATRKRLRPREGMLETWWERALAVVAVTLLMALVASIVVDC